MENKQAILLLSGGIDSTTLLAKLVYENYEITALSFQYGQKHNVELEFAKVNARKYGVKHHKLIELDSQLFDTSALVQKEISIATYRKETLPKGKVNAYVPFRNMVFISMGLSLAENLNINEVYLAFNKDDCNNFWDCKKDFVNYINQIARFNGDIEVKTPFIELTKQEVVILAKGLNVDLNETMTCYQPTGKTECGVCLSCLTKIEAIEKN
jgi:7-cyano-7-deazaguanine synthase